MSVYGGLVIKPVNNTINEEVEQILEETCFGNITGVAFSEFQNYLSMLSECTDESERSLLETKIEVLQEVSVKEIKDNIKKFIGKIIQFIKDAMKKIKEFFTDKKKSYYKKKCADLEKKLKESDLMHEKLKADVSAAKKDAEDANTRADQYKDRYEAKSKDYDNLMGDYADARMDLNDANKKADAVEASTNDRILKLAEKIATNKYLYFDIWHYMTKEFDPQRICRSNILSSLFTIEKLYDDFEDENNESYTDTEKIQRTFSNWLKNNAKYMDILNEETRKALYEKTGTKEDEQLNLRWGGYNHRAVHEYIEENLDQHKNDRIVDLDHVENLMERLTWLSRGYQVYAMNEILAEYQRAMGQIEKLLASYFDKKDANYAAISTMAINVCKTISTSVRVASVLSDYAGRACGAAYQAIDALSFAYGVEKPKW